jgi:threonine dehydratase
MRRENSKYDTVMTPFVGRDFDTARQAAEQFASDRDLQLIPSFYEHLVRGVATYAKELFDTVADLATVYVPVGLGSGASGLIPVRDLLGLTTEIVGVVSSEADAVAQSIECGRAVQTATAKTFADGVAVRVVNADSLAILQSGLARIVRVTDDEIADAMRLLYRTTDNVAEGAGAAANAALKQEQQGQRGNKVAVILTGGNIDGGLFADVMLGNTPAVL